MFRENLHFTWCNGAMIGVPGIWDNNLNELYTFINVRLYKMFHTNPAKSMKIIREMD